MDYSVGLIADVRCETDKLSRAIEIILDHGVKEIICLGNVVDQDIARENPLAAIEVLEFILRHNIRGIRGEHENAILEMDPSITPDPEALCNIQNIVRPFPDRIDIPYGVIRPRFTIEHGGVSYDENKLAEKPGRFSFGRPSIKTLEKLAFPISTKCLLVTANQGHPCLCYIGSELTSFSQSCTCELDMSKKTIFNPGKLATIAVSFGATPAFSILRFENRVARVEIHFLEDL